MQAAAADLNSTFTGVNKMLGGYRTLNATARKTLGAIDNLFG